jgi:hypothetical protein
VNENAYKLSCLNEVRREKFCILDSDNLYGNF